MTGAFEAHPRDQFLPDDVRPRAGYDGPLEIGHGQTNSQPRTVSAMLRLLDVRPGMRVLDVGSGSGWTTALLAHVTGPDGEVLGLEAVPDLVALGQHNLDSADHPWARIEAARPGVLGNPDGGPYDRILVSAQADELPAGLLAQLADDGVLVMPVAGVMLRAINPGPVLTEHGRYRFVPLR